MGEFSEDGGRRFRGGEVVLPEGGWVNGTCGPHSVESIHRQSTGCSMDISVKNMTAYPGLSAILSFVSFAFYISTFKCLRFKHHSIFVNHSVLFYLNFMLRCVPAEFHEVCTVCIQLCSLKCVETMDQLP